MLPTLSPARFTIRSHPPCLAVLDPVYSAKPWMGLRRAVVRRMENTGRGLQQAQHAAGPSQGRPSRGTRGNETLGAARQAQVKLQLCHLWGDLRPQLPGGDMGMLPTTLHRDSVGGSVSKACPVQNVARHTISAWSGSRR